MEFAIQLSNLEPTRLRAISQAAEGVGFDHIVFPDHIVMEGPERQYDPHTIAFDPMILAATVADATKKVKVGHLVLCNLFRHPAITAQSLVTIDHVSNGRLLAGLGTGWAQTEFEMTGIPFPPITERLRMLGEALECIVSLWANERTTFKGEFYQLKDAILWPKPVQKPRPPIIIGGGGKGLLRLAAKYGDYVNIVPDSGKPGKVSLDNVKKMTDESFGSKLDFVRQEAASHGRDPKAIKFSNFIFNYIITNSKDETRKMAEMMAAGFGMPSPDAMLQSPMSLIGTPDECIAELKRRAKGWGVSHFAFASAMGVDEEKLRTLYEQVLAHV